MSGHHRVWEGWSPWWKTCMHRQRSPKRVPPLFSSPTSAQPSQQAPKMTKKRRNNGR